MQLTIVHNVEVVANRIRAMGGGMRKYMAEIMTDAMNDDIMPIWDRNIQGGYLSEATRREAGYPYSTRYGKDSSPFGPDYEVHENEGTFFAGSHVETGDVAGNPSVRLVNTAFNYEFLRYGTRFMRPRDPGGEAMGEALPEIQIRFKNNIEAGAVSLFAK